MNKIKIGDNVFVRSGKDRTKTGVVQAIFGNRAVVSGINIVKKHQKKTATSPQGGIIEKSLPIAISKLMLVDAKLKKPSRVGYKIEGKEKIRIYRKSQEAVVKKESK